MLAKVGITWNVELLDPAAISEKLRKVDYDFAGGGWAWIFDPDQMATGLYHPDGGFNFGRSNNPKAIALIEAGRKELDLEKRTKIYWELEKVVYDNYEDAFLWYPMDITIYRKNVQGWNMDMYLKMRESQYYSHPCGLKTENRNEKGFKVQGRSRVHQECVRSLRAFDRYGRHEPLALKVEILFSNGKGEREWLTETWILI